MSLTSEVIVLFCVVLTGALCRRLNFFTDETIRGTTQIVVNITLPCLTISNMQRDFSMDVLRNFLITLGLSMMLILLAIGGALLLFGKRPHDRLAVLANLQGFSNCGFMGYPIILAFNPDWMIYAVAYNIAYTVFTWTIGLSLYQGKENMSLRRVLLNPNLISAAIGFVLFCTSVRLPVIPAKVLSLLGGLTTPLSMLLIGTRVCGVRPSDFMDRDYHISALLRLVVQPLFVFALMRVLPVAPAVAGTIFLLTAMPSGTMTAMQAELYGGDRVFAARAIAYSTLLSLVTVPLLSMLM